MSGPVDATAGSVRVNGAGLAAHAGRRVTLLGRVLSHSDGQAILEATASLGRTRRASRPHCSLGCACPTRLLTTVVPCVQDKKPVVVRTVEPVPDGVCVAATGTPAPPYAVVSAHAQSPCPSAPALAGAASSWSSWARRAPETSSR
jgi:hypothetical protein